MNLILSSLFVLFTLTAHADEAPLDRPYANLRHPTVEWNVPEGRALRVRKSDTMEIIELQTSVKAQEKRGSCSIFSATSLFEAMIVKARLENNDIDLSEEWLQYLIAQYATSDGSSSPANFQALRSFGQPTEAKLPYIGLTWESASAGLAKKRCGDLAGYDQKRCLVGHRNPLLLGLSDSELLNESSPYFDPEFAAAREEAIVNKRYFSSSRPSGIVGSTSAVKRTLSNGTPLTLDIDFFYGAWNHRVADELGIGRDMNLWSNGIVTYPEHNSMDREKSHQKPAGHSVVIVGYDDDLEITYTIKLKNGSTETFTRRGVYYFKNSWGTDGFGAKFIYEDKSFPGYGMISQDYAHEYGQFFQLSL